MPAKHQVYVSSGGRGAARSQYYCKISVKASGHVSEPDNAGDVQVLRELGEVSFAQSTVFIDGEIKQESPVTLSIF